MSDASIIQLGPFRLDLAKGALTCDGVPVRFSLETTPNDTLGDVVVPGGGSSVCLTEEGTFTVFLTDVSNCSVNLLVTFTVDGGDAQVVPLKSGNIPQGNETGDCVPGLPARGGHGSA